MDMLFTNEVDKLEKLIEEIKEKEIKNKNLQYLIIKLQEINFDLKIALDETDNIDDNKKIENYVDNELIRRDKMEKLLPLFTYLYFSSQ
jgi:RNA polymerase-interacting CarD/CdnL/TRCF family regulator